MTDDFVPTVYLKQNCPFSMKIRIFLLETGLTDTVKVRDFAPGTPEEEAIRSELSPKLAKVSFPSAEIEPDHFIAESDEIIAFLAKRADRDPSDLTVYRNYIDGPFSTMMSLFKENRELKAAANVQAA